MPRSKTSILAQVADAPGERQVEARATWIAEIAVRLHDFEEADVAGTKAIKAFKALQDAFPELDFPLRSEPRESLVEAIDSSWTISPSQFREAVLLFLETKAAAISPESLETGLTVLADSNVRLREGELFLALKLLNEVQFGISRDEGFRALILLVQTGNWRAIITLIEHILADGETHPRVLQAGLESVARYAPSQLGAVLIRFCEQLDRLEMGVLRHIVVQMAALATPYIALLALLELDPLRCPRLLAAAFEGKSPRYRFECDPSEDEEDRVIAISEGGRRLPLTDEQVGMNLQVWISLATTAIRVGVSQNFAAVIIAPPNNALTPSDRETKVEAFFERFGNWRFVA